MAGTNITNLLEIIQRKIDAADASTATQDLLYLLSAVRQGDGSALELYDSSGAFPDLTDSAADTEMIAYKGDSDRLYFNVGVWKGKQPPPPPPPPTTQAQGTNFGYSSGGSYFDVTNIYVNTIDKFPFSVDANASDVGDLTVARQVPTGQSSTLSGYTSGGYGPAYSNVIDKFPFSSDGNASDVGNLYEARSGVAGQSSTTHGYTSGGRNPGLGFPTGPALNTIDKFPFAADANASDVGDLTEARTSVAGQSSTDNGYTSGGANSGYSNVIDKFSFSSDANATDVGDLFEARSGPAGQSSSENGYSSGGNLGDKKTIDKFPFASDANATDVGNLFEARYGSAGQSSSTHGYTSGGFVTLPESNVIDKFPFASDADAIDVGDLTVARYAPAGQQY